MNEIYRCLDEDGDLVMAGCDEDGVVRIRVVEVAEDGVEGSEIYLLAESVLAIADALRKTGTGSGWVPVDAGEVEIADTVRVTDKRSGDVWGPYQVGKIELNDVGLVLSDIKFGSVFWSYENCKDNFRFERFVDE